MRVWIIGHSIVHWARIHAVNQGQGGALELPENVEPSWISRCGMRWAEFLPAVKARVAKDGPQDALLIQLGENNLAYRKGVDVMWNIYNDFDELKNTYPKLVII